MPLNYIVLGIISSLSLSLSLYSVHLHISLWLLDNQTSNSSDNTILKQKTINSGFVLRFQQYCAMMIKHFYNFIRFWPGIFLALVLPITSVLLALIIVTVSYPIPGNDSKLELTLTDLVPFPNNISMFYAEFGSNFPVSFKVR